MEQFNSNGKLLLTAEYFILNGAKALVLPVRFGQSLFVLDTDSNAKENIIDWKAFYKKELWFEAKIKTPEIVILETSNLKIAQQLSDILNGIIQLNPTIFEKKNIPRFKTVLDFDPAWGLGSSSTLIANLAKWAKVDALKLFFNLFDGSGYDIVAAHQDEPFLFTRKKRIIDTKSVSLSAEITPYMYFVYTGKKQSSEKEIDEYQKRKVPGKIQLKKISNLTDDISTVEDLDVFEDMITEHEKILSNHLDRASVKLLRFSDYPGVIKSLGAWGGDFVLFVHRGEKKELTEYLKKKGLSTFFSYQELICS